MKPYDNDPYVLEPPPTRRVSDVGSRAADQALAGLAHGAIIFGFLGIGFLMSLGIAGGVWLYGRHAPYVEYHAKQAGCYQIFVLLVNILTLILIGVMFGVSLLYPQWGFAGTLAWGLLIVWACWFVGSILFGVLAAVLVLLGKPFAYPYFGRRAARRLR
ncbi:MAG: DUF4870 domain-containing protein [Chloroflexia bacterium]